MGTMSVASRTLCLTSEVVNTDVWFLDGKRLKPKELRERMRDWKLVGSWQRSLSSRFILLRRERSLLAGNIHIETRLRSKMAVHWCSLLQARLFCLDIFIFLFYLTQFYLIYIFFFCKSFSSSTSVCTRRTNFLHFPIATPLRFASFIHLSFFWPSSFAKPHEEAR